MISSGCQTRKCRALGLDLQHQTRLLILLPRYRLRLNMEEQEEGFLICQLARNRIAAVCDFLTYCRWKE